MSKSVYIAGPMTGILNNNYIEFFKAEAQLICDGCNVANPAKLGEIPGLHTSHDYWPINAAMLDACDEIYMLQGWEDSYGAQRELAYALNRGMTVRYQVAE